MKKQRLFIGSLIACCALIATAGLRAQDTNTPPKMREIPTSATEAREMLTPPSAVKDIPTTKAEAVEAVKSAMEMKETPAMTMETRFFHRTANANLFSQRAGELAAEKGSTDAIKKFGRKLADDSATAQKHLTQAATDMRVTLPTGLDKECEKQIDTLRSRSGTEFDLAFLVDVISDREMCFAQCETQSKIAESEPIRKYVTSTLPTVQSHLTEARDLYVQARKPVVEEPAGVERYMPEFYE